jgi:hypothetical protein
MRWEKKTGRDERKKAYETKKNVRQGRKRTVGEGRNEPYERRKKTGRYEREKTARQGRKKGIRKKTYHFIELYDDNRALKFL